jgi:hypothetical protein
MLRSAALAAACWLAGCVSTRGAFEPGMGAPPAGGVSLVLLGEAGVTGRSGEASAAALRELLRPGDPALVVLLGGQAAHRLDARGRPRASDGVAPVLAIAREHGAAVAITGAAERRIDPRAATPSTVIRVAADGRARVVSSCAARSCTLALDEPGDDVLELVVLELGTWRHAALGDDPLADLDGLLDALARSPSTVPRVLVRELPVEGGLEHGLGALGGPTATFHNLPPRLQRALQEGAFVGVIAGGEAGVHATHNVGRAIQRTDKTWLHTPVWQVVSGHAAGPAAGHGVAWRRTALARGVGFRPELATARRGFAVLTIGEHGTATLDLYAHRRRKWSRARTELPLQVSSPSGPRDAPSMTPCMRCDEVPSGERR